MNVLHIQPRPTARPASVWQPNDASCQMDRVIGYSAATQCLQERTYDAIVLDVENEIDLQSGVGQLRKQAASAPIIGISDQVHCVDAAAIGLDAFFEKMAFNYISFDEAMRSAIRQQATQLSSLDSAIRQSHESLIPPRSAVHPVSIFPIYGQTNVDKNTSHIGLATFDTGGELKIELRDVDEFACSHVLVSLNASTGKETHATARVRQTKRIGGGLLLDAELVNGDDDLLRAENLTPVWNAHTHRYEVALPPVAVESLVQLGVLTPYLHDRTIVCPDCHATPTLRFGCRACGSVESSNQKMIHHFACAYVGPVSAFEKNDQLVCPKCRVRSLVIGADFEYLEGSHECQSCGHTDLELEMVGQCHACDLRFSMEFALEEDVIGYHVERMDPLAIIAAS